MYQSPFFTYRLSFFKLIFNPALYVSNSPARSEVVEHELAEWLGGRMPECRSPFGMLLVYDIPTTSRIINISDEVVRRHSDIHASEPYYEPGGESDAKSSGMT